jgi:GNAT superfamily N-acetyltransferase
MMPDQPIIRPIRAGEAPEARRLIYSIAHPLMEPQLTLDEMIQQWEGWGVFTDLDDVQKYYFDNDGVFLIVEIAGCIVGTGAFVRYAEGNLFSENGRLRSSDESLRTGVGVCALRRITLLPSFGGHKLSHLAYALMLDLTERARAMGYTKMILWTDPIRLHRAVAFYHLLGFSELPIEGADADELWLGMEI